MATFSKSRIGKATGWALIICAGIIDALQIILDVFAIGLVLNRAIDAVVSAVALALLFLVFRVSFIEETTLYLSLAGAITGEIIPVVDLAPLWTADALYIVRSIQKKDAAEAQAAEQNENAILQLQIARRNQQLQIEQAAQLQNEEEIEEEKIIDLRNRFKNSEELDRAA